MATGELIAGRYRILSLLGEGSMGEVYLARDQDLEREVALKVMPSRAEADVETVERFMRQAPAAARISHPGIVEVYDRGTHGGLPFITMERLHGADLATRIAEYGPFPAGAAARIAGDLAHAVHAAHKAGIVHRDIKPSNVFLAEAPDGSEYVKVLDFGIAKVLSADVSLTHTDELMGTLAYMPPEQLRSSKHVDSRSDVYAIGAVLYAMLSGRRPFESDAQAELTRMVLYAEPTPLAELRSDLPEGLVNLVERAMAKEPGERIATAGVFARLLYGEAVLAGEPPPEGRRLDPISSYPPPVLQPAASHAPAGSEIEQASTRRPAKPTAPEPASEAEPGRGAGAAAQPAALEESVADTLHGAHDSRGARALWIAAAVLLAAGLAAAWLSS